MKHARFIVAIDHDGTLNEKFSYPVAIKHNSGIDSKRLKKIKELLFQKIKEETIITYLSEKGKKDFENPGEMALFITQGFIEKTIDHDTCVFFANTLLNGITKDDIKKAAREAVSGIAKNARECMDFIKKEGGYTMILSDGLSPIVEEVANEIGNIDFLTGQELIFENGVFKGKMNHIDKWAKAYTIYRDLRFKRENGIFKHTVIVDDIASNLAEMKKHDVMIAFCPTESNEKVFANEGLRVSIIKERDFGNVAHRILTYLEYEKVMREYEMHECPLDSF